MAMVQNQWYNFGIGAPPILTSLGVRGFDPLPYQRWVQWYVDRPSGRKAKQRGFAQRRDLWSRHRRLCASDKGRDASEALGVSSKPILRVDQMGVGQK